MKCHSFVTLGELLRSSSYIMIPANPARTSSSSALFLAGMFPAAFCYLAALRAAVLCHLRHPA